MRISSPVTWLGGKARLASRIIKYFPPHKTYVEPFGGSAAVLLTKEPSAIEVFNDIDKRLFNLFRAIRDDQLFEQLQRSLDLSLYSRAEFEKAKQQSDDSVESARRFLVRQRQSFGGKGQHWSYSTTKCQGGVSSSIQRWRSGINSLPAVHLRLRNVQLECDDWRKIVSRFDSPETLLYLDPPYHRETRISGGYLHELAEPDLRALVSRLLRFRGMVVLSGYKHPTFAPLEMAGWTREDFDVVEHVSNRRSRRVESLWISPSAVGQRAARVSLSPIERMREGAFQTHLTRTESSAKKVARAIERMHVRGQKITIVGVARITKMSREHVGRSYRHLFPV
jgi:DNA adenine methylase